MTLEELQAELAKQYDNLEVYQGRVDDNQQTMDSRSAALLEDLQYFTRRYTLAIIKFQSKVDATEAEIVKLETEIAALGG